MGLSLIALILVVAGIVVPFFITNAVLLWVCTAVVLVGAILGIVARKKGSRSPLAMIAIILGFGYLILNIVLIIFLGGAAVGSGL